MYSSCLAIFFPSINKGQMVVRNLRNANDTESSSNYVQGHRKAKETRDRRRKIGGVTCRQPHYSTVTHATL
jgi:hypothetical protein